MIRLEPFWVSVHRNYIGSKILDVGISLYIRDTRDTRKNGRGELTRKNEGDCPEQKAEQPEHETREQYLRNERLRNFVSPRRVRLRIAEHRRKLDLTAVGVLRHINYARNGWWRLRRRKCRGAVVNSLSRSIFFLSQNNHEFMCATGRISLPWNIRISFQSKISRIRIYRVAHKVSDYRIIKKFLISISKLANEIRFLPN